MGPMTLWKPQNRSGDLLGPNCLRGPLFKFDVYTLYIGHAPATYKLVLDHGASALGSRRGKP